MKISPEILWMQIDLDLRHAFLDSTTGDLDTRLDLFIQARERLKEMVKNLENGILRRE